MHYPSTNQLKYSNCTVNPSKNLEENQEICFHHYRQAHSIHYFDQDQTPLIIINTHDLIMHNPGQTWIFYELGQTHLTW